MALTKERKQEFVKEISELLVDSKLTVGAVYSGLSVQQLQQLRQTGRQNGTTIKVVKNRLFKRAVSQLDSLAGADLQPFTGQLVYAFNALDEIAAAQTLSDFAKLAPNLRMVAGLTADGQIILADELQQLANLPAKPQLQAMLIGTLAAPLTNMVRITNANLAGLAQVLSARAKATS